MDRTFLRTVSTVLGLGLLPLACGGADANVDTDAGMSAATDAGARVRLDVQVSTTNRPDAGRGGARADAAVPRDGGSRMSGRTPPSGSYLIYRLAPGNQCLGPFLQDGSADDRYLHSLPCSNNGALFWEIIPVAGAAGVYQVRSYAVPDKRTSCIGISSDGAPQLTACSDASTRWRVAYNGEQEFQLQSVARPNQCVESRNGDWATLETCENNDSQYFTTRVTP